MMFGFLVSEKTKNGVSENAVYNSKKLKFYQMKRRNKGSVN